MTLQEFLQSHQLHFLPTLDGKFHSFEHQEIKGWYIGSNTHFGDKEITTFTWADWRTPDHRFFFKTDLALTDAEKASLKKIEKKLADIEKNKISEKHRETALEAEALWAGGLLEGATPYLNKKGINNLFGCRIDSRLKTVLFVPMRDVEGKLWGVQSIYQDGIKTFMLGQRSSEVFHLLGDPLHQTKTVYIAEGFATAVSVHLATRVTTLVAFNAGNLPSVAKVVRKKFRNINIIIAGDDDTHNQINAGRTKAEEAAQLVRGYALFPKFQTKQEGKGTKDWNDLHLIEGLEACRLQLIRQDLKPEYLIPLGYSGKTYYYTSSYNPQINAITEHSETDLIKLMPLGYWVSRFNSLELKDKKGKWLPVRCTLIEECHEAGIFNPKRIRGYGVWRDGGKTVLHLGDRLFYDGADHPIHSLTDSSAIYEYLSPLPPIHPHPLSLEETALFKQILGSLRYASPEQQFYLGGWILTSWISGILSWRPHLWLTGEQGSGKTVVLNSIIHEILKAFGALKIEGASTEAGIRQKIKASSIPVLFDEFEPENKKQTNLRLESVIELYRQASSEAGGSVLKGSVSGEAQEYSLRFSGLVSSINTRLRGGADRSRFTLVELKKVLNEPEQWERVQDLLEELTPEYSARLFARCVQMLPIFQTNYEKLFKLFSAKHSARVGQQYGTLLAGWGLVMKDSPLNDSEARELMEQVNFGQEASTSGEKDHVECLNHLLHKQLRVGSQSLSIWEMLREFMNDETSHKDNLPKFGVYPVEHEKLGWGALILGAHPELTTIFRDTKWDGGWKDALGRFEGAIKGHRTKYHKLRTNRGVFLSFNAMGLDPSDTEPHF